MIGSKPKFTKVLELTQTPLMLNWWWDIILCKGKRFIQNLVTFTVYLVEGMWMTDSWSPWHFVRKTKCIGTLGNDLRFFKVSSQSSHLSINSLGERWPQGSEKRKKARKSSWTYTFKITCEKRKWIFIRNGLRNVKKTLFALIPIQRIVTRSGMLFPPAESVNYKFSQKEG